MPCHRLVSPKSKLGKRRSCHASTPLLYTKPRLVPFHHQVRTALETFRYILQRPYAGLAHCSSCDLKENLWLCLACGSLGCGRQQYGGVGVSGNGHGLAHFKSTGHGVSVKLGTITPEGNAGVFLPCLLMDWHDSFIQISTVTSATMQSSIRNSPPTSQRSVLTSKLKPKQKRA